MYCCVHIRLQVGQEIVLVSELKYFKRIALIKISLRCAAFAGLRLWD